jgi:hypothetical protein
MVDNRYTCNLEYCGQAEPRWVVRFCGEWVGRADSKEDGILLAAEHSSRRMAAYR